MARGTSRESADFQALLREALVALGPDLQNIIRQSYDKVMTMTGVMTNHTTDAIYKKSYLGVPSVTTDRTIYLAVLLDAS